MAEHERLGKYQIIDVLGRGAMGIVYKGFDPGIDRTVAIKTVRKELIEDDDRAGMALARFRNEARAAGRLSHPGIVAVYDYGESGAVTYIAMEYVQGNSLREYFNRGARFTEADVVSIMAQLLEALQHAHEAGVWHRDIKPANLIIMGNGRLKIADFGIARIETSQLTQTGVVMGSPGYMAPEQYSGGMIDWRADLFACGVVMHQLLTGQRLFTGSAEQLAYKICHQPAPAPSAVDPGKGWERYDAIVAQALAKSPDERFASAAAFRETVLAAYAAPVNAAVAEETIIAATTLPAGLYEPSNPSARTGDPSAGAAARSASLPPRPLTIPPPPPPAPAPQAAAGVGARRGSRSRWPIVVTAALAVVVGVGIGGWWMRQPPKTAQTAAAQPPQPVAPAAKPEVSSAPKTTAAAPAPKAEAPAKAAPSPQKSEPKATPRTPARRKTEDAEQARSRPSPVVAKPRETHQVTTVAPTAPAPASRRTDAPAASPVGAPVPPAPAQAPAPVAVAPQAPAPQPPVEAAPLTLAPPPPPSIWRDQGITMKVSSKLQFHRRLWSAGIQVETNAGIVTLRGTVSSKALSDEAEKLAAAIYGVHGVKNEIEVKP